MKKLITLTLVLFCVVGFSSCKATSGTNRDSVSNFSVATFEYAKDDGYKLITSEIDSLDTFDSLLLKPSDTEFEGEWIYRIVFNPQAYSKNTEEYIILFGEQSISINGQTYVGDGVPYSEILEWVSGKYVFFEYELMESDAEISSN